MKQMELTREQIDIINSTGNIKINAVAGSGKTTTIIEYAASRPIESKILYLAFNKSVKLEASRKFSERNLQNVKVETAHSLSYRHIVAGSRYKVKPQGYTTNELVDLLKIRSNGEKHIEFVIGNHIKKFISYFCNSDKQKVQELNYLDIVSDSNARLFVNKYYDYIENQTRAFLSKMNSGEIEIIHDFYLKKFQLSDAVMDYDYILFDEGQDASPAMLDVFFKQDAVKVIVGDTHQQIYSWRFAVNSLEKADFKTFRLSTSFRFGQDIADIAAGILKFKNHISNYHPADIKGNGICNENKVKAILARSNLGLLQKAIEYVSEGKRIDSIYFEGNINSYTYADDGASLYDVLHLYNNRNHLIRDKLIKSMKSIDELEKYIKKTEDAQLGMMIEIIKKYGNKIPGIIKKIKDRHLKNDEKEKAEMIFSTVHRSKGMEYDSVYLVNDFINEEKLEKLAGDEKTEVINSTKLNEEINLLYVAITRTKNLLHIPDSLLPKEFPNSPQIRVVNSKNESFSNSKYNSQNKYPFDSSKEKKYVVRDARLKNKDAYKPWTKALDTELTNMFVKKVKVGMLAKHFGRTTGAIVMRIKKLELE